MRFFKFLTIFIVLSLATISYSAVSQDQNKMGPSLTTQEIPIFLKSIPDRYHPYMKGMLLDIRAKIIDLDLPTNEAEEGTYYKSISEILRNYAQTSLPFMVSVDMKFLEKDGEVSLISKIFTNPNMTKGMIHFELNWNITKIKQNASKK